jgi:hypothetical protein
MRFQVRGLAECLNCAAHGMGETISLSEEINAKDEADAIAVFSDTKRLCKRCKASGIKADLQVDRDTVTCTPLPPPRFK